MLTPILPVYEVVHESNTVFLRDQRQGNIYGRYGQLGSAMGALNFDKDIDDLFLTDDACVDYYDWPILAAGCVFSHTLLDALMVQAMYNSNIISFWEALTCTGDKGKCAVNDHQKLFSDVLNESCRDGIGEGIERDAPIANSTEAGSAKGYGSCYISPSISQGNQDTSEGKQFIEKCKDKINMERMKKRDVSAVRDHFNHEFPTHTEANFTVCDESKDSLSSLSSANIASTSDHIGEVEEEQAKAGTESPHENSCRSLLDKIIVPPIFVGKAFSIMFSSCFQYNGIIIIALYRLYNEESPSYAAEGRNEKKREYRSETNKRSVKTVLPFVVTAPSMKTILLSTDEVFILRASTSI